MKSNNIQKDISLLTELASQIETCEACGLCKTRRQAVPGEGSLTAKVFFLGEGPGADEDKTGRPFVGRAGKLLDKIIEGGMNLRRQDVYISNSVRCRPPNNRVPALDELKACRHFLQKEIDIIKPQVIITLGKTAFFALMNILSGTLKPYRLQKHFFSKIPVVPTWHPAYLLRNPNAKSETWQDIKFAMSLIK